MGVTSYIEEPPGIRKLSDSALRASMERALEMVPATSSAAVIDVGFDKDGIIAVAVVKLSGQWSLMGGLDRRFTGDWTGHVAVRWFGR